MKAMRGQGYTGSRKKPDLPCAGCGRLMYRGASSLPEGQATCLPCRRQNRAEREAQRPTSHGDAVCPICHGMFDKSRANQVYCSAICRNSRRPNWTPHVATSTERGYGKEHREERERWKPIVESGQVNCCLCGYWIEPGSKWHLDHTPDRTAYRGVAHFGCNTKDGASRGARRANAARPVLGKVCATCGSGFTTIYPKQAYCSVKCRPSRQAKPKVAPTPRYCLECGVTIKQGKRCKPCAGRYSREYTREVNRKRYRETVGIPVDAPLRKTGRPRVA